MYVNVDISYMISGEKQPNFKIRASLAHSSNSVPSVLHKPNRESLTSSCEPVIPGTVYVT